MQNIQPVSRRNFLKVAGLAGAGLGLAACRTARRKRKAPAVAATAHTDHAAASGPTNDEMDEAHAQVYKHFVDNLGQNPAFWATPLAFTMDNGVKVFELTCQQTQWEVEAGRTIDALPTTALCPVLKFASRREIRCEFWSTTRWIRVPAFTGTA
jgi:manganese oxidase